jgi:hypothetical protein
MLPFLKCNLSHLHGHHVMGHHHINEPLIGVLTVHDEPLRRHIA